MKQAISTGKAPKAIGPYSQAVNSCGMIYSSGQIAMRADGTMENGGIEEQTRQVLDNIKAILDSAGTLINNVVKTTVYMKNMDDFATMNSVYEEYFSEPYPARSTVEISRLPKGALIEIDVVACM